MLEAALIFIGTFYVTALYAIQNPDLKFYLRPEGGSSQMNFLADQVLAEY